MKSLDRNVLRYLRTKILIRLIIEIPIIILYIYLHQRFDWHDLLLYIPLLFVLLVYIWSLIIQPRIYTRVTKYSDSPTVFIVQTGWIFVSKEMLPVRRIQDITLVSGILSRRFNLGVLRISTASRSIVTPPIKIDVLDRIQADLIERVKEEKQSV